MQPTKKRRTDEDGSAVVTATASATPIRDASESNGGKKANGKRTQNERFKRVDPTKIAPIADNSFVARVSLLSHPTTSQSTNLISLKPAPGNDYGRKAHEDLIVTRGAGFRKEKNKKKRGSYRGGEITVSHFCRLSSDILLIAS